MRRLGEILSGQVKKEGNAPQKEGNAPKTKKHLLVLPYSIKGQQVRRLGEVWSGQVKKEGNASQKEGKA